MDPMTMTKIANVSETRNNHAGAGLLWGEPRQRLAFIVDLLREMSLHDDPQAMVRSYGARMRELRPIAGWLAISRRGLESPFYRITRSSSWTEEINPWKQKDRLPLLSGGFLSALIYSGEPRVIDDLAHLVSADDPAHDYLAGYGSMMAIPHFDRGESLNMTISLQHETGSFDREMFPEWVWLSGLFGRATQSLVLSDELKRAYEVVERELKVIADIQRSLLPRELPRLAGVELATYYRTSRWAGGDYYDFFPLPEGRLGVLIADVSGHGAPAAVLMAITHSLAHGLPGPPDPPGVLLGHVNHRLALAYTTSDDVFVTAFYGVLDPARRSFTYSCAGHNPPRLKRCRRADVIPLDEIGGPPLGLFEDLKYDQITIELEPDDVLALYTDGITEAMDSKGVQFGVGRLDEILGRCELDAQGMIDAVVAGVDDFTGMQPPEDDRTLLVIQIS